jgi:peptidoglycan L-alanyl-D-glutamate endopeptidase CwlK
MSQDKEQELHTDLQRVVTEVKKLFPCKVIVGHRNKEDQDKAFNEKKSKLQWPNSKHNTIPSKAMDIVPLPVDWNDLKRFYYFAGYVMAVAKSLNIKLRWGGDWNSDTEIKDNSFNDLPHFELVE